MLLPYIKSFAIILLAFVTAVASAQQDVKLPGIVVEQNSKVQSGKVTYIQGASIKAMQASPQMSDANGRFTLVFADVPAGNITQIGVDRNGYEVVNAKVLQAASVAGRKAPLEIVMCRTGLLYQNQLAYYNIAADATREQYENKLKILQQGGIKKDELIARLQKEMNKEIRSKDEALRSLKDQYQLRFQQSQTIADKFVTVNLDDESETYQRAFKAFENNDVAKAISLLDSVNLENRLATNTQELQKEESSGNALQKDIEKRKLQVKQDVSQCMFKGRLHILQYDYATATKSFLLAIQYDSSNTNNLFEIASFFLDQKSDSLANKYFNQLLSVTHFDYGKAMALADIGDAYKKIGNYDEAEKYYPASVKILKQLYKDHPDEYRVNITDVLNRFGTLYYDWEFYSIAGNYFDEAEKIYIQTYDSLSNTLATEAENLVWFDIINNKCLLYYKYKNYYAAMRYFNFQAIPVLQKVINKNTGLYKLRMAQALYNQGFSEFYLKEYEHSGDDLSEALSEIKTLAEKNPDKYSGELGNMLNGLAQICFELQAFDKAGQFYDEALKAIRKIEDKNSSDLNLSYLVATLDGLGKLNNELKNYSNAEKFYEEALTIQTQLAEKKPFLYSPGLVALTNDFGNLYANSGNYEKATSYYNSSIEGYRKQAEKNPEIYSAGEANVLYNLGSLNMGLKKYEAAEKYYIQALDLQNKLLDDEKKMTISEQSDGLALVLSYISKTLKVLDRLYANWRNGQPNRLYLDVKNEYTRLVEKNTMKPLEAVISLNSVGKFCYKLGIYSKAEQDFNTAMQQFFSLSKEDQNSGYGFNLASTAIDLLNVYQRELEVTKDFSYRDKAAGLISKAQQWNESDPNAYDYSYNKERLQEFDSIFKKTNLNDLKVSTTDLENIERKLKGVLEEKDTLAVIAGLEQIIKDLEIKHKESSGNQQVNNLLAQACGSISWYYVFEKQFAKTLAYAKRGLALDSTQTWIYSNLALGYLSLGKWPETKKIYEEYKDFAVDPDHSYKDMFLDDLHALKEAGILLPNMREAEEFLLK